MDYKKAGVDIEAGYKSVELMKEHVKKTMRPEVLLTGRMLRILAAYCHGPKFKNQLNQTVGKRRL